MLRVLLPTFESVLQQIKVTVSWVNTDFWLDKIVPESRLTVALRNLLQSKFALDRVMKQECSVIVRWRDSF